MRGTGRAKLWIFLFLSVSAYLVGFSLLLWNVLGRNGGHFEYAVDDAYIHMAVAKNYVLHGVFGITRYGFTSSLSSILWPWLLIGAFKVVGVSPFVPLGLNVAFSLFLIVLSFVLLPPERATLLSLSLTFLGSTLSLTFVGLEHVLQILATLLVVVVGISPPEGTKKRLAVLFVLSALATATRYEGMAVAMAIALYRLLRRDIPGSVSVVLGGALPVLLYGLWSKAHGWYFLPTSVLTKAYRFNLHSPMGWVDLLGLKALRTSLILPGLYSLWILLLLFLATPLGRREERPLLLITLFVFTAHLYFGNVHWFYRYEAYIVSLALFSLIRALDTSYLREIWERWDVVRRVSFGAAAFLLLSTVVARGYMAVGYVPSAASEVYRQDYQMALFVKEYYGDGPVVLNDVGNVAFYTDARIIDLWGLATLETARMLLEGRYTQENVDSLVREKGGRIAVLYGDVFAQRYFPVPWEEVGLWYLLGPRRFVVGNKTVYFYAVLEDPDTLRKHFTDFSRKRLPDGVYWEAINRGP